MDAEYTRFISVSKSSVFVLPNDLNNSICVPNFACFCRFQQKFWEKSRSTITSSKLGVDFSN
jgi:hypothetical protein